jgi:Tfp pilus assembly protein PilF
LAVIIELVGLIGWTSWRRALRLLRDEPLLGAAMLAESPLLRLPPVSRRSRRLPGSDLIAAGDTAAAEALDALGRDQSRWAPVDSIGFVNLARADLIRSDLDAASVALESAMLRDPTSATVHRLAAITYRARGMSDEALEHLAVAFGIGSRGGSLPFELTPDEDAWVRLEGLSRRLEFYPRSRSANIIALAREYRTFDQAARGREVLEEHESDPRVALELAAWELLEGNIAGAETRLTGVVSKHALPSSILAEAWTAMAMVKDRQGDREGALSAAERALTHDPRSAGPYRVLATLAERRGDVDEALDHLRRAWGMNPTDVGLLLNVARVAEKGGAIDDARLALERAVTVDAEDPGLRARLVEFHLRQGELMQATLRLSEALSRFPTDERLLRLAERLRAEVSRR